MMQEMQEKNLIVLKIIKGLQKTIFTRQRNKSSQFLKNEVMAELEVFDAANLVNLYCGSFVVEKITFFLKTNCQKF